MGNILLRSTQRGLQISAFKQWAAQARRQRVARAAATSRTERMLSCARFLQWNTDDARRRRVFVLWLRFAVGASRGAIVCRHTALLRSQLVAMSRSVAFAFARDVFCRWLRRCILPARAARLRAAQLEREVALSRDEARCASDAARLVDESNAVLLDACVNATHALRRGGANLGYQSPSPMRARLDVTESTDHFRAGVARHAATHRAAADALMEQASRSAAWGQRLRPACTAIVVTLKGLGPQLFDVRQLVAATFDALADDIGRASNALGGVARRQRSDAEALSVELAELRRERAVWLAERAAQRHCVSEYEAMHERAVSAERYARTTVARAALAEVEADGFAERATNAERALSAERERRNVANDVVRDRDAALQGVEAERQEWQRALHRSQRRERRLQGEIADAAATAEHARSSLQLAAIRDGAFEGLLRETSDVLSRLTEMDEALAVALQRPLLQRTARTNRQHPSRLHGVRAALDELDAELVEAADDDASTHTRVRLALFEHDAAMLQRQLRGVLMRFRALVESGSLDPAPSAKLRPVYTAHDATYVLASTQGSRTAGRSPPPVAPDFGRVAGGSDEVAEVAVNPVRGLFDDRESFELPRSSPTPPPMEGRPIFLRTPTGGRASRS